MGVTSILNEVRVRAGVMYCCHPLLDQLVDSRISVCGRLIRDVSSYSHHFFNLFSAIMQKRSFVNLVCYSQIILRNNAVYISYIPIRRCLSDLKPTGVAQGL